MPAVDLLGVTAREITFWSKETKVGTIRISFVMQEQERSGLIECV
jgi:hypothetical protein